jgi:hypothetical protein
MDVCLTVQFLCPSIPQYFAQYFRILHSIFRSLGHHSTPQRLLIVSYLFVFRSVLLFFYIRFFSCVFAIVCVFFFFFFFEFVF